MDFGQISQIIIPFLNKYPQISLAWSAMKIKLCKHKIKQILLEKNIFKKENKNLIQIQCLQYFL